MNSRNRDGKPEFENHLLSIKTERQKMIHPNSNPTYNERHEKIIEMIDWALGKYRTVANINKNQHNGEQEIIDNIIEELDKKGEIAINKKKKALLKDEVSIYRFPFIIRELTGNKLY